MGLVSEWTSLHQAGLAAAWQRAENLESGKLPIRSRSLGGEHQGAQDDSPAHGFQALLPWQDVNAGDPFWLIAQVEHDRCVRAPDVLRESPEAAKALGGHGARRFHLNREDVASPLDDEVHLRAVFGAKRRDASRLLECRGAVHDLTEHEMFEERPGPVGRGDEVPKKPVEDANIEEVEFRMLDQASRPTLGKGWNAVDE